MEHNRRDEVTSLRMVVTICACVILSMSTWFSTAAVIPQLKMAWQISTSAVAWLSIAVQLGFVAGALIVVFGRLADRVSPHVLIAGSAAGAAIVNLGLVFVGNVEHAIALRLMTGVFMAGIYPPALKLVATWSLKNRGIAFGAVIGALTIGSALPHLISAGGGVSWRWVIVLTSLTTVAGGLGILILTRVGPHAFPQAAFRSDCLRQTLFNRTFVLVTIGYLGHMWELYAAWSWMLVIVRERLGESPVHGDPASMLTFLIILAGAPACVAAGYLADRHGRVATTKWFMVMSGLCAALIGITFAAPVWVFVLVGIVWGATMIGDSGQFSALITEADDRTLVGTALTVQLGLGFALTSVTIWLVPVVAGHIGWQWTSLCLVPGPVIGIMAMSRLARTTPPLAASAIA